MRTANLSRQQSKFDKASPCHRIASAYSQCKSFENVKTKISVLEVTTPLTVDMRTMQQEIPNSVDNMIYVITKADEAGEKASLYPNAKKTKVTTVGKDRDLDIISIKL